MDYTRLSLSDVTRALRGAADDAQSTFGALYPLQLNWRPTAAQWSVGQCLEHLLTANALMLAAAGHALANPPESLWQRVPLLPRVFGQLLIRSQSPQTTRKFTAPDKA